MKDLKDAIYEASKQLKAAKFENIPAKDLYSELVKGIQKAYEKDIKNGWAALQDIYDEYMKGVDGNNVNPKATLLIGTWGRVEHGSIKQWKWDGKRNIVTDEVLDLLTKLFETCWHKPVINGVRQTTREVGVGPSGNNHFLQFKFPDGTKLTTNLMFGSLQKLLKYATEKDYKSSNIHDEWNWK